MKKKTLVAGFFSIALISCSSTPEGKNKNSMNFCETDFGSEYIPKVGTNQGEFWCQRSDIIEEVTAKKILELENKRKSLFLKIEKASKKKDNKRVARYRNKIREIILEKNDLFKNILAANCPDSPNSTIDKGDRFTLGDYKDIKYTCRSKPFPISSLCPENQNTRVKSGEAACVDR